MYSVFIDAILCEMDLRKHGTALSIYREEINQDALRECTPTVSETKVMIACKMGEIDGFFCGWHRGRKKRIEFKVFVRRALGRDQSREQPTSHLRHAMKYFVTSFNQPHKKHTHHSFSTCIYHQPILYINIRVDTPGLKLVGSVLFR